MLFMPTVLFLFLTCLRRSDLKAKRKACVSERGFLLLLLLFSSSHWSSKMYYYSSKPYIAVPFITTEMYENIKIVVVYLTWKFTCFSFLKLKHGAVD